MTIKKIGRREALGAMGAAAGAAIAVGCGSGSPTSPTDTSSSGTTTTGSTNAACAVTPSETAGPYPSLSDIFRSDIRDGKTGTLLALTIKVVNVNAACAAVPNANVEVWHCDSSGNYSEYGTQTDANVSARNTDDQQLWGGHVHDDLSGLVSRAGHAHPRGSHSKRRVPEDHADCVSREHQHHRLSERRLRVEGIESDIEPRRRHLRRQPVGGARHAVGRSSVGLRRELPGRDRCVDHTKQWGTAAPPSREALRRDLAGALA